MDRVRNRPLRIACRNEATTPLGVDFVHLVAVLQRYADQCLLPAWGPRCSAVFGITDDDFNEDVWGLVFLDNADVPDALAYHELAKTGLPISLVFVKTTRDAGESVSATAAHEVAEMLVDPLCTSVVRRGGVLYSKEVADPVEETSFALGGLAMSNFVLPAYFEDRQHPPGTRFDWMGVVKAPFEIRPGGYQQIYQNGKWSNVFGSEAKAARFAHEDRRFHRTELRMEEGRVWSVGGVDPDAPVAPDPASPAEEEFTEISDGAADATVKASKTWKL